MITSQAIDIGQLLSYQIIVPSKCISFYSQLYNPSVLPNQRRFYILYLIIYIQEIFQFSGTERAYFYTIILDKFRIWQICNLRQKTLVESWPKISRQIHLFVRFYLWGFGSYNLINLRFFFIYDIYLLLYIFFTIKKIKRNVYYKGG